MTRVVPPEPPVAAVVALSRVGLESLGAKPLALGD